MEFLTGFMAGIISTLIVLNFVASWCLGKLNEANNAYSRAIKHHQMAAQLERKVADMME